MIPTSRGSVLEPTSTISSQMQSIATILCLGLLIPYIPHIGYFCCSKGPPKNWACKSNKCVCTPDKCGSHLSRPLPEPQTTQWASPRPPWPAFCREYWEIPLPPQYIINKRYPLYRYALLVSRISVCA